MKDEKIYETIPVGRLGLIPVDGCQSLAKEVAGTGAYHC